MRRAEYDAADGDALDRDEKITGHALRELGGDFDHDPEEFKPYMAQRWLLWKQ